MPRPCHLCEHEGGVVVWSDERLRVVRAEDTPDHPAFYRVIWQAHLPELSDLSAEDRAHCIETVVKVERVLRDRLMPTKMNIASLGNQVPHLHWHVIPRFDGDAHFPQPIWGPRQRTADAIEQARLRQMLPDLDAAVAAALELP
jgi:diadenosine tetraphosphate (Ap4A) HIT family hydrolase